MTSSHPNSLFNCITRSLNKPPCYTVINKVYIILIIFLKVSEQYITGLFSSTLEPSNPWHINSQRDPEIPHFAYESLLESLLSFRTENWKVFFHIWYFLCHAVYLREIRTLQNVKDQLINLNIFNNFSQFFIYKITVVFGIWVSSPKFWRQRRSRLQVSYY